jgi:RNA polymerase sigma-70 factor (ECF subfamily)
MLQVGDPDDHGITPEVIESCRRGDRDALHTLYEAYKDKVYSIAFYFFHRDPSTASDITQQVFLKLIGEMGKFRGDAAFSTWLYRLVVNACVDRARRSRAAVMVDDPAVLQSLPDPLASHEETLARTEMAQSVQAAIGSLPPKLRLAILLRYFDELSYGDMAAALNCSIGTVSSRLSRGHRLLAKKLAPLRGAVHVKGV